jgi:nitronate monooxygenase
VHFEVGAMDAEQAMWNSGITRTYGVHYPFIGGGMAMIAEPRLAAAVSEAGGIGQLGTGPLPPPLLRERIREVRGYTSQPFAVNLIVETMPLNSAILPTIHTQGDFEEMCLAAGAGLSFVRKIEPAAEIVRDIMDGAASRLRFFMKQDGQQSAPSSSRRSNYRRQSWTRRIKKVIRHLVEALPPCDHRPQYWVCLNVK